MLREKEVHVLNNFNCRQLILLLNQKRPLQLSNLYLHAIFPNGTVENLECIISTIKKKQIEIIQK